MPFSVFLLQADRLNIKDRLVVVVVVLVVITKKQKFRSCYVEYLHSLPVLIQPYDAVTNPPFPATIANGEGQGP